jgi:xylulokinase
MMFDIRKHRWDEDILSAVGITPDRLARPVPSGTDVGVIPRDTASSLGFIGEVRVLSGGHDQPMGALGAGVIEPGKAMYATGTSEAITPAFPEPILNDDLFTYNICTYDFTIAGMYTTVVFSLTGGNILKWFRDEWGYREQAEAETTGRNVYEVLLDTMDEGPSPVLVLPYFTPSGTPYYDAEVSGALFGLHLSTKRQEVLRGLLEGVAFEMRLNLDIMDRAGIRIDELRAIGGGARSPAWVQLKADVLDTAITRVAVTEAAGYACAMLGCSALTGEPVESIAGKWVRTEGVMTPNPEKAEAYRERFAQYRTLYPALKELNIT